MFSFWEKESFIKKPDIIIIGSGIVGLSSAICLKEKNPSLHIIVLERGMLPYGASTRNAGFACYGSVSELLEDLEKNSPDEVFTLVEKRWKGLKRLRNLLGDKNIRYEPFGGYEVFTENDEKTFELCADHFPEFNKKLFEITGEKELYVSADDQIKEFGFDHITHIIKNKGEGQIDTGKMMRSLLLLAKEKGVEVLNGAEVGHFEESKNSVSVFLKQPGKNMAQSSETVITTSRLLICVNGFAKKFLPDYDIQPARSQVLITSPIDNLKIKGSFHYDHGYYYFRNVGNRVLFGGGRNSDFAGEATEDFGLTDDIQSRLVSLLKSTILPAETYSIEMQWSGIMGLGEKKSPIIRQTGNNIFCAVRMGGMGIAIGTLVGEEAAEMVVNSL